MPLYRFRVHDDSGVPESGLVEYPDYETARAEAATLAGAVLKDADGKFWESDNWRVDVEDQHGLVLCSIMIAGVESAAVERLRID